ncbi:MAG: hypothetical protein LBU13_02365 [Synergistaceae bacterium]|jgi:hypothetical protein|nr:hypothetical protein [Synergistaceae bacterium]
MKKLKIYLDTSVISHLDALYAELGGLSPKSGSGAPCHRRITLQKNGTIRINERSEETPFSTRYGKKS